MHGTILATNAVLTEKGAELGLLTAQDYEQTLQVANSFCSGRLWGKF
ncbi:hypothetical protein AB6T38_09155 [Aliiglaciecola sp. SL4]